MYEPKPKKPWGGFGYLIIIVLAIIVAVFVLGPLGHSILNPFQKITSALQGK